MSNISIERDGLTDGMPRDERGYWMPDKDVGVPNPVFSWPPKPRAVAKWVKDYLWPHNILYMIVATLTWIFLTPELARMREFEVGWMLEVFLRNQLMLIGLASVMHVRLWTNKSQGFQYKWSPNWMSKSKKFLWNDQVRDNVFWSVVSAGTIWTGFEIVMLWAYANGIIPYLDPRQQPAAFVVMLCLVQLWREFHFYWAHRFLHVKFMYKIAHYVHHKNIDIGPWSGLSMHPVEHLLYYTCMLIHWVVASHPIHMIMNGQHATFAAILGHGGFDEIVVKDGVTVSSAASYYHSLHHRYFECNYGEMGMPFDHWFGTSHDGTPEARERMLARKRAMHGG